MKRIIYGVTYDTNTARRIAMSVDEDIAPATLYQTDGGAFFLHEDLEEEPGRGDYRTRHRIEPLTAEEAHDWLMTGDLEVFESPFGDPPEATDEKVQNGTIYLRVPMDLKLALERECDRWERSLGDLFEASAKKWLADSADSSMDAN